MAKAKLYVTEVGTAMYPRLTAPDPEYGNYTCKFVLDEIDAEGLIAEIDSVLKTYTAEVESRGKKVNKVHKPYTSNDDGTITFNTKLKPVISRKDGTSFTQEPKLYDKNGKAIDPATVSKMGNGTKLKLALEFLPYGPGAQGCGVSLKLTAAQIIELVEYNPDSNSGSTSVFGETQDEPSTDDTPFDF